MVNSHEFSAKAEILNRRNSFVEPLALSQLQLARTLTFRQHLAEAIPPPGIEIDFLQNRNRSRLEQSGTKVARDLKFAFHVCHDVAVFEALWSPN